MPFRKNGTPDSKFVFARTFIYKFINSSCDDGIVSSGLDVDLHVHVGSVVPGIQILISIILYPIVDARS